MGRALPGTMNFRRLDHDPNGTRNPTQRDGRGRGRAGPLLCHQPGDRQEATRPDWRIAGNRHGTGGGQSRRGELRDLPRRAAAAVRPGAWRRDCLAHGTTEPALDVPRGGRCGGQCVRDSGRVRLRHARHPRAPQFRGGTGRHPRSRDWARHRASLRQPDEPAATRADRAGRRDGHLPQGCAVRQSRAGRSRPAVPEIQQGRRGGGGQSRLPLHAERRLRSPEDGGCLPDAGGRRPAGRKRGTDAAVAVEPPGPREPRGLGGAVRRLARPGPLAAHRESGPVP